MEQVGWLTPDEFWEQYAESEKLVRDSAGELPCFGVVGWSGPVALGEWDFGSRPPITVSLAYGAAPGPEILVRTTSQDPQKTALFQRMMVQGPPTDARDLAARQRTFESEPAIALHIPVDGDRVSFTLWRESDRWWAAGTHACYGLVLEAREIDPDSLALEEVHDIEPYLAGSRSRIRAARGEN